MTSFTNLNGCQKRQISLIFQRPHTPYITYSHLYTHCHMHTIHTSHSYLQPESSIVTKERVTRNTHSYLHWSTAFHTITHFSYSASIEVHYDKNKLQTRKEKKWHITSWRKHCFFCKRKVMWVHIRKWWWDWLTVTEKCYQVSLFQAHF